MSSPTRTPARPRSVRTVLTVSIALVTLASVLLAPFATGAEGAGQEAELTCGGGATSADVGFSGGLARAAAQGVGGTSPMTCTVVVPADRWATFRWYGVSAPEPAQVSVALTGATVLASTTVVRPVSSTVRYRVPVWTVVLRPGTTTLTATRDSQTAVVLDYWTLDPDTAPPTAPSGLAAQRSGNDVTLTWGASSDNIAVTGYRVRSNGGPWTGGVSSPWVHAGAGASVQDYEVQAYDASGNHSSISTVSYTPPPDTTPPSAPTGLNASRAGEDVSLAWAASSDNVGVTGYRVRVNGGPWTSGVTSPWIHAGAGASVQDYEVQAYDAAGNVSASGTVRYTPARDAVAPSTPGAVTATRTGSDVSVTWSDSTDDVAVTGYRISADGGSTWRAGVVSPWVHVGTAQTSQTYWVQAYDAAGNLSGTGSTTYAPTTDTTAPSAPGSVTVTAVAADLSVTWTASTDDTGVTGYRIRADGGEWVYGVGSPWPHPGAASTSHRYDVQAYDAAGNFSPVSTATYTAPPDTTPPSAPANPGTTDIEGDVSVTWDASSDNVAVTGYRIRVGTGAWIDVVESPWLHVGGAPTAQTYEVQAYDAAGNHSASSTVTHTPPPVTTPADTTAPSTPAGLSATGSGPDVVVSWTPSTDDTVVAGYRIRVGSGDWTTMAGSPWTHAGGAGSSQTYDVQAYDAAGNLSALATVAWAAAAAFTATPVGSVLLTSPAPGSGLPAAVPTRITWLTSGLPGPAARVELIRDTDVVATLAGSVRLSAGSLPWTPAHTLVAEGTYRVRLTSTSDERITSTSALFAITHPSLRVTSHAASTRWTAGASQTVTWSYAGTPVGGVRVQIARRGQVVTTVVTAAPFGRDGRGSATFTVPAGLGHYDDYRLRVSYVAFPASADESDADSAYQGLTALHLTTPAPATTWTAGQPQTVRWSTAGAVTGNVRLDLLKGSEVAAVIAPALPAAQASHTWTPPSGLAAGGDYTVRITSVTAPTLFDRTPVTVEGASLTLAVADPGSVWIAGTPKVISWSPAGAPGTSLRLDLVSSTGRLVPIGAAVPIANGSFTWNPPLNVVPAGNYRVRGLVVGNVLVSGLSPVPLTLAHPGIVVTEPSDAPTWTLGAPTAVSWQLTHRVAAPVTLSLVRDTGSTPIAAARPTGADGSGSFTWTPPLTAAVGPGHRVRVTAAHNPAVRATSPYPVALRRPLLTLDSPVAGTVWDTGTTVTAAWQFDGGARPEVRAELLNGAAVVAVVTRSSATAGDGRGTLSWAVPATVPGGSYQLRLRPVATASSAHVQALVPVQVNGPTVAVSTPTGWSRGSTVTASWAYTRWAGTTAKVELVSGTRVTLLGSAAPMSGGGGSLSWTVPTTVPAATTYRIRVTLPGSATATSGVFAVS